MVNQLNTAISTTEEIRKTNDSQIITLLMDGTIHRFECTFDICWKLIQRWLKENRSREEAENPRSRKDLFRMAARCSLIRDPLAWFEYGEARNLTSHTYNMEQADITYNLALRFAGDAAFLLKKLEEAND